MVPISCRGPRWRSSSGWGRIRLDQQQVKHASDATRGHHTQQQDPCGGHILVGMCGSLREPRVPLFGGVPTLHRDEALVESLILAQDQRWRRA